MRTFAAIFVATMAVSSAGLAQTDLTLGTSSAGGSWYPAAQVMARVIQEEVPDVRVTVMPGGSLSNVQGLSGGQYDIAFAHSQDIVTGIKGREPFKAPIENVTAIASLWTNYFQVGVRPDTGITSIADMRDKAIAPGNRGWGGEAATRLVLGCNDMTYDDMGKVEFAGWQGITDLYKDRHVDAVFAVSSLGHPSMQEMAVGGSGMQLTSMDDKTLECVFADNPAYYRIVVPANAYPGTDSEVVTFGSNTILAARDDLPADLIEQITAALMSHHDELVGALAALGEMTPEFAAKVPDVIGLHEGARAYYTEAGAIQ